MGGEYEEFFNLLKKLANAFGPSGYEDEIREIVEKELDNLVDEVWRDKHGNVYGRKRGSSANAPKVVIAAHMDEIGFMIKYIDDKGFLYLAPIGGWNPRILPAQRLRIRTRDGKTVRGVIGVKPPHIMTPEEQKQVIPLEKLFVDIGASSREDVEKLGIRIGSLADLDRETVMLPLNNTITGKSFDDRVGVAVMIWSLRLLKNVVHESEVIAVATVQEEVGLKGAKLAVNALKPDALMALDVTVASDVPGVEASQTVTQLGKGPAIKVMDGRSGGGLITHPRLLDLLIKAAEEEKIPYQLEVLTGGTTDASAPLMIGVDAPSAAISVPTRYIHSPVEVLRLDDAINAAKLLTASIKRMTVNWFREAFGK